MGASVMQHVHQHTNPTALCNGCCKRLDFTPRVAPNHLFLPATTPGATWTPSRRSSFLVNQRKVACVAGCSDLKISHAKASVSNVFSAVRHPVPRVATPPTLANA